MSEKSRILTEAGAALWGPYLAERFGDIGSLDDEQLQALADELEPHLQTVDEVLARWQELYAA